VTILRDVQQRSVPISINDPALAHKTHSKTAQKILPAQKQPPAPTLFFGNLGFETTDAAIRELLEAHRPGKKPGKDAGTEVDGEEKEKAKDVWIRKVRMGTFEDSGLGYAANYCLPHFCLLQRAL
jgi:hypothetical protein